jgi:hypothetical protein
MVSSNNLNRELNWNEKFVNLLKKSLGGRNKNIIVEFNVEMNNFKLYSVLEENDIRILLLEINLININ